MMSRNHARSSAVCALCILTALLTLAACGSSSTPERSHASATVTRASTPASTSVLPSLRLTAGAWAAGPAVPQDTFRLAVAPSAPLTAFACTSKDGGSSRQPGPHLFKTTDGGKTWQPQASDPQPDMPCQVFINPADANDVILQQILSGPIPTQDVISSRYLWRSHDGGTTWQQLAIIDNTFGFGVIAFLGPRLVASAIPARFGPGVGCPNPSAVPPPPFTLIYASDDGGTMWQPIGQSIVNQHLGVVGLAVMGDTLVVSAETLATECDSAARSYWQSSDAGASWSRLSVPISPGPAIGAPTPQFTRAVSGGSYYGVLNASSGTGDGTILYTADSGASWIPIPYFVPAGAPSDRLTPGIGFPLVTSSGAIVATFTSFGPYGIGPGKDIVTIRPSDPTPTWKVYAPNDKQYVNSSIGALAIMPTAQGDVLWVVDGTASWYLLLP
jgi:hypothetical protein